LLIPEHVRFLVLPRKLRQGTDIEIPNHPGQNHPELCHRYILPQTIPSPEREGPDHGSLVTGERFGVFALQPALGEELRRESEIGCRVVRGVLGDSYCRL
jgi:hypothetical protein